MFRIPCAVLLIGAVAFAQDAEATKADHKKLQGTWTIESAMVNGKEMKEQHGTRLVFEEDKLKIIPPGKDKGGEAVTFKNDATKKLKTLSLINDMTKKAPNLSRMIYEVDDDTLKIAIGSATRPPTAITDKGHILWTLKRAK